MGYVTKKPQSNQGDADFDRFDGAKPLKIVVAGPVGAGKTSFVRGLSEIEVVSTEEAASEDIGKAMTTVAMDFGALKLDGQTIHVFGTPGQDRFDFMWEILCEGALGMILLVAGDKPQDFPQARKILEFITSRIAVPFIVGVTRQDLDRVWHPDDVADYFDLPAHQVIGLNATSSTSATLAMIRLLESIEHQYPHLDNLLEGYGHPALNTLAERGPVASN
jgi:uncharacterized protein